MQSPGDFSEIKLSNHIYSGNSITDAIEFLKEYDDIFIVYDNAVEVFANKLIESIRNKNFNFTASLPLYINEKFKNLQTVMDICSWLLQNNANRGSLLIAIGGGVTTDIAGFAGSIYKRGMRTAFIPTTILAQTDAAIGGKNGVNFLGYKNIIGTIRQPDFVFECPEVLETLPYRDFVSGSAEILKSFIINNKNSNYERAVALFSEINNSLDRKVAISERRKELLHLIGEAAKIKAEIVNQDPFEKGIRKVLNLGHTFAHAIEWKTNTSKTAEIMHGEAVAIGIVFAAIISATLQTTENRIINRIIEDFASCGLPTSSPFSTRTLLPALFKDKKAEKGIIHFILIEDIGKVVIKDINAEDAVSMIEKYYAK